MIMLSHRYLKYMIMVPIRYIKCIFFILKMMEGS